eukprot:12699435-Heterocapsa_arctica.AAC.1
MLFLNAACVTCQGATTAWAPGSVRQCNPSPKKKASLLENMIPFKQQPLTAERRLLISLMASGAAALP